MLAPPVYPSWLYVLGRIALLPLAVIAKVWTLLTGSDFDEAASAVPPFDLSSLPQWPVQVIDESLPPNQSTTTR
jgi:hypothetical protein